MIVRTTPGARGVLPAVREAVWSEFPDARIPTKVEAHTLGEYFDGLVAQRKLGPNAAEDLLDIFVRRHEAASTLITTNRPTQDWGVFLGDVPAAAAILDRFLAHATIVQMTGKSYRLRQRAGGADD